ncbi:histidine kinase-like protein [Actinokineospora auranticolor]|uniref:Histidine kinase-like protein n=2 Tax=Actinokineospora auranticolor TaxID=155976 RepID=A0A2S6GJ78_9PSEU|nr:histidine kinase-like protein [Actinokineospora auranticolor]
MSHQVVGERAEEILLGVSEAVTNSVEHAYPPDAPGVVTVRADVRDRVVRVSVSDRGHWRAADRPRTATDRFRGRGLRILRALASHLRVDHGTNASPGTTVEADFPLPT